MKIISKTKEGYNSFIHDRVTEYCELKNYDVPKLEEMKDFYICDDFLLISYSEDIFYLPFNSLFKDTFREDILNLIVEEEKTKRERERKQKEFELTLAELNNVFCAHAKEMIEEREQKEKEIADFKPINDRNFDIKNMKILIEKYPEESRELMK